MTRTASIVFIALLGLIALANRTAAQRDNPAQSTSTRVGKQFKKVTISGIVGADGKTLIREGDKRIWNVTNPESLKPSEGHHVTVKALVDRITSELKISTVRLRDERLSAKLDDSAFRR